MGAALADGGIETALTERLGQELPEFAAFVLLDTAEGVHALREYYRPFIELADREGLPLVLDTPTWRANPDWVELLGRPATDLARVNAAAVALLRELVAEMAPSVPVTVNGCVGPRTDDFVAEQRMSAREAEEYHTPQVLALAAAGVDRVTSVTTLDVDEAVGVVAAARRAGIPAMVSFTVGDDGRLPSGETLDDAIRRVDEATGAAAAGFAINCAHPDEARAAVRALGAASTGRLRGFRLNAAHHGDDGAGDAPADFARGLVALREVATAAEVFGGCCGTDVPHIAAVAEALASRPGSEP